MKKNDIVKIIGLIFLSGILGYLSLQIPLYISYAIDGVLFEKVDKIPNYLIQVLEMDKIKSLIILSVIIIIINLIVALGSYIRQRITTTLTLDISHNLKKILYSHILKLEYESYQSYSKVEMLQRVNDDAQQYAEFYKVQFNLILDLLSFSFFIITQGISLNRSITLYLVLTIVLMLTFALWYYHKMTEILEKVIVKKKKMLGAIIENVNQFNLIRIFNRQKEEIQKYKSLNKDYTEEDIKLIKLILFYDIINEHITYLSKPIICLLGGISIMQGKMTMGGLTALLLFSNKILTCLYSFGDSLDVINTFIVVKQKIKKLMELEEEKKGKCYNLDGDIVFHKVGIKIDQKQILTNLNFTIKKGEKVVILGQNGSGKSILAKVILGFYSKIQGNIYLNYHNIRKLDKSNIREYIDFVSGEADLFAGSILDNIQLDAQTTQEQLGKVTKQAQIQDDIQNFEESYLTMVGEKGVKLSGGQKQRILIARTLLRNKPIIIFDHAFSKLDNKTSDRVLHHLIQDYPQTTMIFISHKLEIKEYVNKIIKLEKGTSEVKIT